MQIECAVPIFQQRDGPSPHILPGMDIARISRVIDIAAGTGSWAIDFASLPEVRDSNVQVFACDISSEKYQ